MAITRTDVENVFGANFVAQWSSFTLGTNANANTDRISLAISWATSQVNQRLASGPYVVPIQPTTGEGELPEILDAKATLAGWWLWKTRGLNQAKETVAMMNDHYMRIMKLLQAIRSGGYPLAAAYNTQRTNTPFVV